MKILKSVEELQTYRNQLKQSIGFVPTMGALHEGHISLVNKAKSENFYAFVSIFVNPTQFNDPEDLQNYPQTLKADLAKLKDAHVDAVFLPQKEDLYTDNYEIFVDENNDSQLLCGQNRPGHFRGVLTVVLKLLNLVQAKNAYFGEKDYQQLQLIKKMCASLFVPTEIIGGTTVRESDGLAMSSRNLLLSKKSREKAALLNQLLKSELSDLEIQDQLTENGFEVDYLEQHWGRRFGAVNIDGVRLIDNEPVQ